MASTYLQAIRRVFTDLRESDNAPSATATSLTDSYHLFVGSILNNMLEEVESAHEWWALHQSGDETYTASASSEAIDAITVTPDSRVMHVNEQDSGESIPLVFDITDSSQPFRLREMPLRTLVYLQELQVNDTDVPEYFALEPNSSGGLNIRLYPKPDNARTVRLHMCVPQARLDPTVSADLGTTLLTPDRLSIMGTVWYCLAERGEELGVSPDIARERYLTALTDEIAREVSQTGDERYDLLLV